MRRRVSCGRCGRGSRRTAGCVRLVAAERLGAAGVVGGGGVLGFILEGGEALRGAVLGVACAQNGRQDCREGHEPALAQRATGVEEPADGVEVLVESGKVIVIEPHGHALGESVGEGLLDAGGA